MVLGRGAGRGHLAEGWLAMEVGLEGGGGGGGVRGRRGDEKREEVGGRGNLIGRPQYCKCTSNIT